jgi:hypothetical protein
MKIQLIKEYDKKGDISYHVDVDGEVVPDSIRYSFHDARAVYETIRTSHTISRTVILLEEQI